MKAILVASAALFAIAGAAPASATDYPWCQRTFNNGGTPQCTFMTFRQCQATISGIGGDCIQNPRMAYGSYRPAPRRNPRNPPQDTGWDNNGWNNNGWGDNGWDRGRW